MSNELWVAVIAGISSLLGSIVGVVGSAKVLTYRVTQLEEKMKKQCENCSVMDGRVDKIEKAQAVFDEKLKVANHRIEDLEETVNHK